MSKITRRFFLGAGAALVFIPWAWLQTHTERPRRAASRLWRRFHRWRTGMHPQWSDWSSTRIVRWGDLPEKPCRETTTWRELRWPDTNELVEKTEPVIGPREPIDMDHTVAELGSGRYLGGVEWHDASSRTYEAVLNGRPMKVTEHFRGELAARLPGPKCATGAELIEKIRAAASRDLESAVDEADRRWIVDCRDTVLKWGLISDDGYYYVHVGHEEARRPVKDWRAGMTPASQLQVSGKLASGICSAPEPGQIRGGKILGVFADDPLMAELHRDTLPVLRRMDEHDRQRTWSGMHWESVGDETEVAFEYMGDGDLEMRVRKKAITEAEG